MTGICYWLLINVMKKRNVEIDTWETDDVVWYFNMHVKCVLEERRIERLLLISSGWQTFLLWRL